VQVTHKKCGALVPTNSFKLAESEVISSIYCAPKSGVHKYLVVATLSCQMYVINYQSCQNIHKFDLHQYRLSQMSPEATTP
jgi:hypothetical protein